MLKPVKVFWCYPSVMISALSLAQRLFVALDVPDADSAITLARRLSPLGVSFKIGMQLFYAEGMPVIRQIRELQGEGHVFVDLKLHDIPNTVAGAVDSLVRQGVDFLNVHTQGGPEMMRAAVEAAQKAADTTGQSKPVLIGVTLLTSLSKAHLQDHLHVAGAEVSEYVQHLALQAQKSGLDGVVCSAQEAEAIRRVCGPEFLLVTPGIRPADGETGDQARVITPAQALKNGSDYLVVGRPITGAAQPADAAKAIIEEMEQSLA